MLRVIVVPLDGSSFGEQPLPTAIQIAERQRAELELVHVYVTLPPYLTQGVPPFDPALDAALRKDRQGYLDSVADWVRKSSSAKVTATLLEGLDVAPTLAAYLTERHADLVVMATHGRGGLSRVWLGSVANDLVRHAETPVLLIRPIESGSRENKALPFQHLLVPLDGTTADEEAIDDALVVAGEKDVELVLLHVVVPVVFIAEPVETALLVENAVESAMTEYLENVARRVRARGVSVVTRVKPDPSPVHAILELASEHRTDLIAMETHARTGLSRLLLGSVTDKVIRAAQVPVLVHRRKVEAERAGVPHESAAAERGQH
jgi:nucleotide-binding universal stress UspA family protein